MNSYQNTRHNSPLMAMPRGRSLALKASLSLSGLLCAAVGSTLLFAPAVMHGANGVDLGNNASLLSEVRAPGGALLALGSIVLGGAFVRRLAYPATIIAATVYLSYGFSRMLSIGLDGMPAPGLIVVAALEIALGIINAGLLMRWKYPAPEPSAHSPA